MGDTHSNYKKAGGKLMQMESRPACDTYGGCLTETAAPQKLQKDMDAHPKDYFIPNFGVDRHIIDSKADLANTEKLLKHQWKLPGELVQLNSIPAFNSDAGKSTETASPWKQGADAIDYGLPHDLGRKIELPPPIPRVVT